MALLVLLMAVLGVVFVVGQNRAIESLELLRQETLQQRAATDLRQAISQVLMAVNDFIITGKGSYRDAYYHHKDEMEQRMRVLRALALDPEEADRLPVIETQFRGIDTVAQKIFSLEGVRTNPASGPLMEEMDYSFGDRATAEIASLCDLQAGQVEAASAAVEESRRRALFVTVAGFLVALVIGVTVVVLTIRTISRPILGLVTMAQRITARDFSIVLKAESEDEVGMLVVAFNAMADEIRRRYDELEQFAFVVAHDLKSPLSGIKGTSQLLKADCGDKLDDTGRECLDAILRSTGRMTTLIDELLEFATAGKVEFAKEPISLSQMLSEIQADLSFLIKEKNVTITVQPNLPTVQGDPVRLSQVWRNLISNSIKYNDKKDPAISIGFHERNGARGEYEFYVTDNGIGIPEHLREEVFMPFRRATTDPRYEGTGIGLAIVKRVLEFHRARITVESKLGEWTTFRFTLPKPSTAPLSA